MLKRALTLMTGAVMAALFVTAVPASAATGNGTVYIVHGIPGATVDVYVNATKALPNFTPGTVAGPLSLPAGSYAVKILKAGDDLATGTPVISANVTLPAGANVSLVANLDASGKPVLSTFVNDTSSAAPGKGRLIVRHTAAAPAVDVLANGSPAFTNVANGQQGSADLAAGTVSASVVATGTTSPVLIGPANATVTAGMATIVYAIGAPASGSTASTLGVVTQQVPLAGPTMVVQTGTSGLLDRHGRLSTWPIAALVLGLIGLTVSAGSLVYARARA